MMSTFVLDEVEAGNLLSSYGIPMAKTVICNSFNELDAIARDVTFPVVMKILSPDILHKTDAGAVILGISSVDGMSKAYQTILMNVTTNCPEARIKGVIVQEMQSKGLELIFGVNRDAQFGHVLLFGIGGIYVEILNAVSMRLAPLTRLDALEMIRETPLGKVFQGARGAKYNEEEVIQVLLNLSRLVQEHPEIIEIDINPFLVYEHGKTGCGVDALILCEKD